MKPSRKSMRALWCILVLLSAAACSAEKSDWKAANNHPSTLAFEQFLAKYPNGRFSDAAGQKLEELRFRDTAGFNTLDSYQSFLKQYPSGRFTEQARQAIDALDWGTAQKEGSAQAWQKYLSAHSTGGHSGEATARLDAIATARAPEFRSVQTIAVSIRLTFTDEVKDVVIGFEPVLEEFFQYIGVRKSSPGSPADATITVASEAQPLSENYSPFGAPFGGTTCYTGALVSGTVALGAAGKKKMVETFTGEIPCPSTIAAGSQPNPSDAPFEEAMEDGFPRQAALLLARAFGFRPLIDALSSGSDRVAQASVAALERGGDSAQTLLAEALSSSNPKVQIGAAKALRGHNNPGAVGLLVSCLEKDGEENKTLRETAAASLSKLGAIALPSLELSCKDARPSVREASVRALGGIRTAKSMSLLTAFLDDSAKSVKLAAIDALGEHRSLAAVTLLIDRLGGPADETREAYLAAVEKSTPPESTDLTQEELNPDFSWTGGLAARLIQVFPLLESRPALQENLRGVLSRIGEPAVMPLIQALKSDKVSVRQSAADVLGRIADDRALRPLDASAKDPEKPVRLAAAKALSSFTDARVVQPLARLLLDQESEIRAQALTGLRAATGASDSTAEFQRALSSPEALRALVTAMDIPDASKETDRDAASEILGKIGKPAGEALTACLKSPNQFLREGAVSALGTTQDERGFAALIALSGEPGVQADNAMMTKIYSALGASKNRKALDVLTQGLAKDQDQGRRSAAAAALGELGDIRAVDPLVGALDTGRTPLDTTIQEAISKLTNFTPEADEFDWKSWWAQNRRRFGLKLP